MKRTIIFSLFISCMSHSLLSQEMMDIAPAPRSRIQVEEDAKREEQDQAIIDFDRVKSPVTLNGKTYFQYSGTNKIFRFDTIYKDNKPQVIKTMLENIDGDISNMVVLGNAFYFVRRQSTCDWFGHTGKKWFHCGNTGLYGCQTPTLEAKEDKLIAKFICRDKIETKEISLQSLMESQKRQ